MYVQLLIYYLCCHVTLHTSVLKIVFESVQQKHLDKTSKLWILWRKKPHEQALYISWHMIYKINPLDHDCSWLIINLAVRSLYLFCCIIFITSQTICPVKCNFVWTRRQNVRKIANCWSTDTCTCRKWSHLISKQLRSITHSFN